MMSERAPSAMAAGRLANAFTLNGAVDNDRFFADAAFLNGFCAVDNCALPSPLSQPVSAMICSCEEMRRPAGTAPIPHSKSVQPIAGVTSPCQNSRQVAPPSSQKNVSQSVDSGIHQRCPINETAAVAICRRVKKPTQLPLADALSVCRRQFSRRNGVINSSNRPVEATLSLSPTSSSAESSPPYDAPRPHDSMAAELLMRRSFNAHRKSDFNQLHSQAASSTTPTTPSCPYTLNGNGSAFHQPAGHLMISAMAAASSQHYLAPQRPLRRCRSASPASSRPPLLIPEQQSLIKKSWQRVSKTAVGCRIARYLTDKCKDVDGMFRDDACGLSRHERYFVDLIQSAVDNLDDVDKALYEWLETIGDGHRGFAITTVHWDAFGEAMTCALTNWVGPGKSHRETVRAWRILFSYVSERLGAASRRNQTVTAAVAAAAAAVASAGDSSGGSTPSSTSASCCNIPRIQLLTLMSNGPLASP